MNLAFIYGFFSSNNHGKFNVERLYTEKFLTGSESYFFNTIIGLGERGHKITAFFDVEGSGADNVPSLKGANVRPLDMLPTLEGTPHDAVISWNEPDWLKYAHPKSLRVCCQQLNDFDYSLAVPYNDLVDVYTSPSKTHVEFICHSCSLDTKKFEVLPNSTNIDFFQDDITRDLKKLVYCSSPDRGLHHLLRIFPEIRKQVPGATLNIYYRLIPWIEHALRTDLKYRFAVEFAALANRIKSQLEVLGVNGENGLTVVGPTPNRSMARELKSAGALVYPCDTTMFTEGFGVSILDACAAGAIPIISDMDSLGQVYDGVAEIISGRPGKNDEVWITATVKSMTNEAYRETIATRCKAFAEKHDRKASAEAWDRMLLRKTKPKPVSNFLRLSP